MKSPSFDSVVHKRTTAAPPPPKGEPEYPSRWRCNRPHLYSIVLALVVPSANEGKLFYQFLRLRDSWPQQAVEIKGSQVNEDQTAQAMKLKLHGPIPGAPNA